jgi:hypothetical protein
MKLHLTLIPIIGAALAKGCAKSGAEMSSIAATKAASRAGIYAARDYYQEDYEANNNENMLSDYSFKSNYSDNFPIADADIFENKESLNIDFTAESKETAQKLMTNSGSFLEYYNIIQEQSIDLYENQLTNYEETYIFWKERTTEINNLLYKVSSSELDKTFIKQVINQLEIIQKKKFKKAMKLADEKLKIQNQNSETLVESGSDLPLSNSKSDSLLTNAE